VPSGLAKRPIHIDHLAEDIERGENFRVRISSSRQRLKKPLSMVIAVVASILRLSFLS
jgi:hypothetical protein